MSSKERRVMVGGTSTYLNANRYDDWQSHYVKRQGKIEISGIINLYN